MIVFFKRLLFFVLLFILTFFIFVYPFEIIISILSLKPFHIVRSLGLTALFFGLIVYYFRSKTTFILLRLFVYEGIGIGFFSFFSIHVLLLITLILPLNPLVLTFSFLAIVFVLSVTAYGWGRIVRITPVTYKSGKLTKAYRLAFISDLHLGSRSSRHLAKVITHIKKLNVEALFIGGDLIDSSSFNMDDLSLFSTCQIPIYFVTGNHEYYLKEGKDKLNQLSNFSIHLLDNEAVLYDNLNIIGLSDNQSQDEQLKQLSSLSRTDCLNITLVHKPSIWDHASQYTDIMLSGHTHRGQIFPFNFLVKLQFPFLYGPYISNNSLLFVSSGAGTWGPRMRFCTFNEVVCLELFPEIL